MDQFPFPSDGFFESVLQLYKDVFKKIFGVSTKVESENPPAETSLEEKEYMDEKEEVMSE